MAEEPGLPTVVDPWEAEYAQAQKKLKKAKDESLKSTAETYGARGRFYSGILPQQEQKVEAEYGQQLSDVAQNIAVQKAAEEKAAQRVKEAQAWQSSEAEKQRGWGTSEREMAQKFTAGENALGREFTTNERKAVQDFNSLEASKQRDWSSAEAALGRKFTTSEREAIQAYQTGERENTQQWQSAETALGRKFTTDERLAVQEWQDANDKANKAWQALENDKNRALTTAELLGYFMESGEKKYTMTGQEQQLKAGESAEQLAAAQKMGFKNITEMNTYLADPEMAKKSGIYNNEDRAEIKRLVAEYEATGGRGGAEWLMSHYKLTFEQAKNLLNQNKDYTPTLANPSPAQRNPGPGGRYS